MRKLAPSLTIVAFDLSLPIVFEALAEREQWPSPEYIVSYTLYR